MTGERRMKALIVPLVLVMGAVSSLAALSPGPQGSFQVGPTFLWGMAQELVYPDGSSSRILSQLDWPIPPSIGVEVSAGMTWWPSVQTTIHLAAFKPWTGGTMTDDDWDAGDLVRGHSTSDSGSSAFWNGSVSLGFPLTWGALSGTPSLGICYLDRSWEAWGGRYRYTYADGTSAEGELSGQVLTYRQEWYLPYLGVDLGWDQGWFEVQARCRVSPYAVCEDSDHHGLPSKDVTYRDDSRGGYGIAPEGEVVVHLGQGLDMGISVGGWMVRNLRGDSTAYETAESGSGAVTVLKGQAGAQLDEVEACWFVRTSR